MRKTLKTLLASVAVIASLATPLAASVPVDSNVACNIEVVRKDFRIVETMEGIGMANVAWLIEIENSCQNDILLDIFGQFTDEDGFALMQYTRFNAHLPAEQTETYSGLVAMSLDVANQISEVGGYYEGEILR